MSAFQILINQCVTKIIAYICDQNTIFFSMKVKGKRFLLLYINKKDSKKKTVFLIIRVPTMFWVSFYLSLHEYYLNDVKHIQKYTFF